jgi:hypothetical protein
MAGLEDMFRSAAPGGSIAKPLMLALLALLASGALFRGGGSSAATTTGSQPLLMKGRVVCWADWVDCWTSYRRADLVVLPIPG